MLVQSTHQQNTSKHLHVRSFALICKKGKLRSHQKVTVKLSYLLPILLNLVWLKSGTMLHKHNTSGKRNVKSFANPSPSAFAWANQRLGLWKDRGTECLENSSVHWKYFEPTWAFFLEGRLLYGFMPYSSPLWKDFNHCDFFWELLSRCDSQLYTASLFLLQTAWDRKSVV